MAVAAQCLGLLHVCRIRATRLDASGNPVAGPNNVYVTNNPIMVTVTPQVEVGAEKTVVTGCDCITNTWKGFDKLKRFDLEFDMAHIEPALLELLLGATAIIDSDGNPIGIWWPDQTSCSDPQQPNVCFEAWDDLVDDDHPASPYPYAHWIWPSTHWQIAPHTLQNEFVQPKVTGYTRGNPNWGLGIFGDQPEAAKENGGFFYTKTLPTAQCGWQSHST